ncbi:MAG: hypothetical protein ACYTHJ_12835 [Planctomycetota bacterium]
MNEDSSAGKVVQRRWISRRLILIGGVTFLFSMFGALLAMRDVMDPLTVEALAEARRDWQSSSIDSYRITYTMNRDRYEVECEDGIVRDVTVNGQPPRSSDWRLYGMSGLFDIMEMDLDNLDNPYGPFAGAPQTIFLRARFHPAHGYVQKYVRSSVGPVRGASIEVETFVARED